MGFDFEKSECEKNLFFFNASVNAPVAAIYGQFS